MTVESIIAAGPCQASADDAADRTRPCFGVVGLFADVVGRLAEERARDGMLGLDEVKRILAMVCGGSSPLARALEGQESRCRKAFRPSAHHASSRNDVFRRLMVRPFETLLEGSPAVFPRHFLPNYFEVVEAAFGDKLGHYEQRSREIFQDMLVRYGNDLAWDVFFADPRVRAVMSHGLTRLMGYIEGPAGQWAWLTAMSRANVDGAKPTSAQADLIKQTLATTCKALGPPHQPKKGEVLAKGGQ